MHLQVRPDRRAERVVKLEIELAEEAGKPVRVELTQQVTRSERGRLLGWSWFFFSIHYARIARNNLFLIHFSQAASFPCVSSSGSGRRQSFSHHQYAL
jgi:hypothetical protein